MNDLSEQDDDRPDADRLSDFAYLESPDEHLTDRQRRWLEPPGWGGQAMIPAQLEKVRRLRTKLDAAGSNAELMIDGGVKAGNASACAAAGASVLVCGSSVFSTNHTPAEGLAALRRALQ